MFPAIPQVLQSGPVQLHFDKAVPGDESRGLVPFFHFKIQGQAGTVVGHLNFRVGDTPHVTLCAGHVGFEILPEFRGHAYSYHACHAIAPWIRRYYKEVVLTADPANGASRRIIEKLGADLLEEIEVPTVDPAYSGGARRKCRYAWIP